MGPKSAVIAVGNEIVCGDIRDTNTAFLTAELGRMGVEVVRLSQVRDIESEIIDELVHVTRTVRVVIVTGGLGPTSDDLTRDAIAKFAGLPLELNPVSIEKMKEMFAIRKRTYLPINDRQALFPRGAIILPNPVGTADAFILRFGEIHIVSLPGVPHEMELLFEREVRPYLIRELNSSGEKAAQTITFFGLPEAQIGAAIESITLNSSVCVAYRPVFPEVWVKLSTRVEQGARSLISAAAEEVAEAVGREFVVSMEGNTLAEEVGRLFSTRGLTIATAESCSGGLVAERIVSIPGASKYFLGGAVTYSNDAKETVLGVKTESLSRFGAVSDVVAMEMAQGARERFGSDMAVSVTGIAGPDGGTETKGVGTVWVGISSTKRLAAYHFFYPAERNRFRLYAAALALDLLRRDVRGYRLDWSST